MRYIHYLYIVPLAFLAACSSEDKDVITDTGNGPIELTAGIVEGGGQAITRGAEDNHAKHDTLTGGTALALRVSGTWTGKGDGGNVVKTTTANVGGIADGTDKKHNDVSCNPVLYWDDYGTADPANTAGRSAGLTIYGAAIDGKETAPLTLSSTSITWSLKVNDDATTSDQTASENKPSDKDLLISNNVQPTTTLSTADGNYTFADRGSGKLLEFKHALSKVTVVLTAGDGFTTVDTYKKFDSDPEVILTSNVANTTTETEWAYTKGTINVTNGVVTHTVGTNIPVKMNPTISGTSATHYVVTEEALVMPGSTFPESTANMLRINADGNIYYVTAAKIRDAINTYYNNSAPDYNTKAGFNYIIRLTISKTDIQVTATVVEWTEITSDPYEPVINVNASWGGPVETTSTTTNAFTKDNFSFYRSTSMDTGYGVSSNGFYAKDSEVSHTVETSTEPHTHTWSMSPQLYWPNHNTHYQFRGVWPQTVTTTDDGNYSDPRVETSGDYQVIKVKNVAFTSGFPSELMIGRPDVKTTETCSNSDHEAKNLWSDGICATEGKINLKFEYMMSKVKVELSTSAPESSEYVNLTGAKVELVNAYTTGNVKLGDMGVIQTESTGTYEMHVDGSNANDRLDAIVPQSFTNDSGKLKFRITIMDGSTVADVYEANVKDIDLNDKDNKKITAWESGHYYIYKLKITKTEVKVTATLADWTEVTAQQNVWF